MMAVMPVTVMDGATNPCFHYNLCHGAPEGEHHEHNN
jgi:hypothetical protein